MEERIMSLKYKIGDKVRIKSIDWYNENKNKTGDVPCGEWNFTKWYTPYCGEVMTIRFIWEDDECYKMVNSDFHWTDEMIECKVEEEIKHKFKVGDRVKWYNHTCNITSIDTNENTHIYLIKHDDYREDKIFAKWVPESELTFEDAEETKPIDFTIKATDTKGKVEVVIPEGYSYVIENDKLYFIIEKKEYSNTYEECCKIIYSDPKFYVDTHLYSDTLGALYKLLICRNAYWKIAGEEMGLDKPWEPDWNDEKQDKYGFHDEVKYTIINSTLFVFPTSEMRDAFKDNFDSYIEICK